MKSDTSSNGFRSCCFRNALHSCSVCSCERTRSEQTAARELLAARSRMHLYRIQTHPLLRGQAASQHLLDVSGAPFRQTSA